MILSKQLLYIFEGIGRFIFIFVPGNNRFWSSVVNIKNLL